MNLDSANGIDEAQTLLKPGEPPPPLLSFHEASEHQDAMTMMVMVMTHNITTVQWFSQPR